MIESVTLGSSVEEIHERAFSVNSLTGEVIIPDSVKVIGDDAFRHSRITDVVIGKNIESIGSRAFPRDINDVRFSGLVAPVIQEDSFEVYSSTLLIYVKEGATGFEE